MGKRKDLGLLEKGKEFCKKLVLPAILVGTALLCGCGRGEQSDEEYGYIIERHRTIGLTMPLTRVFWPETDTYIIWTALFAGFLWRS